MIRDRERFLWVTLPAATAVLGVLLTSGSLGYLCARVEVRQHRVQREQAELARADLEQHVEALRAGPLPEVQAPEPEVVPDPAQARRVTELEATVSALRREKADLRKKLEQANRRVSVERQKLQRVARAAPALPAPRPALPAAAAPAPELRPLARVKPPTPPVSAEARVAPAAGACGSIDRAHYTLTAAGETHKLLDERLRLRAESTATGLALDIDGTGLAPLDEAPQHFSWSCGDVAYIVSVCRTTAEPFEVSGEVWRTGDRWQNPCK